ncbi:MAG: FAS1-like dehydratase domain-containing protein [Rhodococcus sp. (in: high G+C Gram-positive bacteria)]
MTEIDLHELSPQLAEYHGEMQRRLGDRERRHIGVVDHRTIRRYAVAIGDPNPLYHDAEAARAAGYADIIAPPNMLAGVVDWGPGLMEAEMNPDGTPGSHSAEGLRVMGAGEEMEILHPLVAGTEVYDDEVVDSVVVKQGRSGVLLFVTTLHEFSDDSGKVLNRNRRTILVRP